MKNKQIKGWLSIFSLFMLIISVTEICSCTKTSNHTQPIDLCSGVTCLNGGTCFSGTCSCPTGYTGTYCENKVVKNGTLRFENYSSNPYYVYVDAELKGVLDGGYYGAFSVPEGTHVCRVLQKSGYASYPTDKSYTVFVVHDMTTTISFP